ncbi:MAG: hypothetical protein BGO61_06890 [Thiobacillus sp. 65-69]|nr:hypothetical protein [Thiobacillus sp.]ODU90875.1 MAG: hypothetical protein ABT21_02310 [Thiobacillus sp. SCN 65-179]OJW35699.1 MAG: hypothetical protein BGO61_06890 [Thiobacillus sp. 65-69]
MNSTLFKKTLSILAFGMLGLTAASAQAAWGNGPSAQRGFSQDINQRQAQQMERIQAGLRNGALTRNEYRTLMQEQAAIRDMERRFRADGRIDAREYQRLDHALDVASRNIRHERHDRQARYGRS